MSKQIVSIVRPVFAGSESTDPRQARVFCGIDVSQETLAVAVIEADRPMEQREFSNTASGHKALVAWLGKRKALVRVSLEATGIYSLDLALALDAAEGVELAVLNPKRVHDFAQSMGRRSKSDQADAEVLAEFGMRMKFVPWQRPSQSALQLRAISRHIEALVLERTRTANRLQAAEGSLATPRCVAEDMKRALAGLERRILKLRSAARELIDSEEQMASQFRLLTGVPGIGEISALQILGELVLLAPDLKARQWVARSGLDPVHRDSGTSVHKPARISRAGSRHLGRALYMPALTAVRCDPHLKAFYESLLSRHKTKLQALIAVARKMLHAIYGIFKSRMPYDGSKLLPQLKTA
ncbi:MAG: IS110 family transposase [Terracidiphilus sp.]